MYPFYRSWWLSVLLCFCPGSFYFSFEESLCLFIVESVCWLWPLWLFCLSGYVYFISIFEGVRILSWWRFSLAFSRYCSIVFLFLRFCWKISCKIILLFEYITFFFLWVLWNLSLVIFNYTILGLCVVFFIFIPLRVPGTYKICWFIFFTSFGKSSAIISINITSGSFPFSALSLQ